MANNPNAFDRDFGYLLPFLDKVVATAARLEDASAREELARLMADEKARWARVRELLQGAQGRGAPAPRGEPGRGAPPLARTSADSVHRVAPSMTGLTVGSLKGVR